MELMRDAVERVAGLVPGTYQHTQRLIEKELEKARLNRVRNGGRAVPLNLDVRNFHWEIPGRQCDCTRCSTAREKEARKHRVTILERPVAQISLAQAKYARSRPPPFIKDSEIGVKFPSATVGPGIQRRVWIDPEWKGRPRQGTEMQGLQKPPNVLSRSTHYPSEVTMADRSKIYPERHTNGFAAMLVDRDEDEDDNRATLPVDEGENHTFRPALTRKPRRRAPRIARPGKLNAISEEFDESLQAPDHIQALLDGHPRLEVLPRMPNFARGRTLHGEEYTFQPSPNLEQREHPHPTHINVPRDSSSPHMERIQKLQKLKAVPSNDEQGGAIDSRTKVTKGTGEAKVPNVQPSHDALTDVAYSRLLWNLQRYHESDRVRINGGVLCNGRASESMSRSEFQAAFKQVSLATYDEDLGNDSGTSTIDSESQAPSSPYNHAMSINPMEGSDHFSRRRMRTQPPFFRPRAPTPPGLWSKKKSTSEAQHEPKRLSIGRVFNIPHITISNSSCQDMTRKGRGNNRNTNTSNQGTPTGEISPTQNSPCLRNTQSWVLHKDTVTEAVTLLPERAVDFPAGRRIVGFMDVLAIKNRLLAQHRCPTELTFSHCHSYQCCPWVWERYLYIDFVELQRSPSIHRMTASARRLKNVRGREPIYDTLLGKAPEGLGDSHPASAQHDISVEQARDLTFQDNGTEYSEDVAIREPRVRFANSPPPEIEPEVRFANSPPPEIETEVRFANSPPPEFEPSIRFAYSPPPEFETGVRFSYSPPPDFEPSIRFANSPPPESEPDLDVAVDLSLMTPIVRSQYDYQSRNFF